MYAIMNKKGGELKKMNEIVQRIIEIRNELGLNQTEFAQKLNLSKSTISLAERGERPFTKRTLIDISEKFGVNYDWLTKGESPKFTKTSDSVLALLKSEYNLDDIDIQIIEQYITLSPTERKVFKDYIKKLL